jgi:Sec-independent protein secretion pathway component TatC
MGIFGTFHFLLHVSLFTAYLGMGREKMDMTRAGVYIIIATGTGTVPIIEAVTVVVIKQTVAAPAVTPVLTQILSAFFISLRLSRYNGYSAILPAGAYKLISTQFEL